MAKPKEILAGDQISTGWWPESVESGSSLLISNITNTAFEPGTPEVGATFEAPLTGRVGVAVSGGMVEQSSADRVFMTFELYLGTSSGGTLVQAAVEVRGISTGGDATASGDQSLGNMTMVENLTPGSTYFARIVYRTQAGTTNDITHRRITVIPMP